MAYVLRATAKDGEVRLFMAITTDMVEKAREIHGMSPTASAALGRTLTVGTIMGVMQKGKKDKLTIAINGGGPAGNIVVAANADGNVKGYISNPFVDIPRKENGKLDVGGAVGTEGMLNVTKDLGLKEPYTSQVPLHTGEIGEDFAYYFTVSEQVPSAVVLGVLVDTDSTIQASGGLIVQMMPGANELLADVITYRLEEIPPLSSLIAEGRTGEEILNMLFDDMDLVIHEKIETDYVCDCTRERIERALITLGHVQLEELKSEDNVQIECHFCNEKYKFTREDIDLMIQNS
jgi:molecular chaperone Hsp33